MNKVCIGCVIIDIYIMNKVCIGCVIIDIYNE